MEKLPKLLMTWATDEMRFQTTAYNSSNFTQLPSEQDFEQLCKKPLDGVWKYVVKHVRSKQAVKEIKGNIELNKKLGVQKYLKDQQKSAASEDDIKLQQERAELARELASCESDIHHLRREMSHITTEVMHAELAYQRVHQRVRDVQKKETILEVVGKCAEERVAKYSEYEQRVMKRVHSITKKNDSQEFKFVRRGAKNKVGDLETECCRDVRLACEAVEEFLHRIVDGSLADKVRLENAQKQLWEKIDETTSAHSVSNLVSALVANTEYAAKDLREKTHQVNINKDAEALSFSYDKKTGLHDLSSPPSVQKCVQELLLAGNEQHVMRWFKQQEHLNEEWKLSARLDDIMMDIQKQVHRIMGDNSHNAQLASSYIGALVQLAEERSVVPCLRAEADSLLSRIQKAKQERQELHLKYQKILDFRELVEKKQNVISTLARQNAGAPVRLDSQKKQVMSYILSRSMDTHATEVRHLTDDLKNSLVSELVKFASVDLSCFVTVLLDSNTCQCVLDLSIAPAIHPLAQEKLHMYADVSAILGFPAYKSTDGLFMHVLQIHDCIQDLHFTQQQRQNGVRRALEVAKTTDDIATFVDLFQKAEQHDHAQCSKLLPKLKKSQELVSAQVARMADVKKQVNIWWEQPAQFTTPWISIEGMTYEQWMQRWRVAVTQLHRKMMDDKNVSQKKK